MTGCTPASASSSPRGGVEAAEAAQGHEAALDRAGQLAQAAELRVAGDVDERVEQAPEHRRVAEAGRAVDAGADRLVASASPRTSP